MVEISGHQVGAPDVDLFVSAVAEVIGAAVLEETADYADDFDVVTYTGNTGPQAADATHEQLDLNAGLRCTIKLFDELRVDQRIGLEDQVSFAAALLVLDFALDQIGRASCRERV